MARNELYTFRRGLFDDTRGLRNYRCIKLDKDLNPNGEYVVTIVNADEPNQFMTCACFAGSKSVCRHRTMLALFLEKGLIDTGSLYEFDKELWHASPTQEM